MKFNFCIWLTCDKTNDIYKYNGGFYPHMTIKMNLSFKESVKEYLKIGKRKICIELTGDPVKSYEDGFAAVYYKIDFSNINKFEKPIWWPKNAHISFLYKYYKMITDGDIENLKNKIKKKSFYLDKYKIMMCNDHHTSWKCIL